MKLLIVTFATLALTSTSFAFECIRGEEGVLKPLEWSARRFDEQFIEINYTVANATQKTIATATGDLYFSGDIPADTDGMAGLVILQRTTAPGGAVTLMSQGTSLEYLLDASSRDLNLHVCVYTISYHGSA
jgi:hypothetical protein